MNKPDDKSSITKPNKKEVTPISCFFASVVSGTIALAVYNLMIAIAETYADKPVIAKSVLAVKIATAVRTLVVGVAALGTGVFALVAVGLFLLGIQLTVKSLTDKESSEKE